MEFAGHSIIAGETVVGRNGTVRAVNPATNEQLDPEFTLVGSAEVRKAASSAEEAFSVYRETKPDTRAQFLETVADRIDSARDVLVARAMQETGLSSARLRGEVSRTSNQMRLFASVVERGDFHGTRIDPAQPDRNPTPRVDLRQRNVPLGPVAVFGASNFPLAFSAAGGDTASALAAGCPVIVKAHNAHPGTSEIIASAVNAAVEATGMPAGVFSLLYGPGAEIGQELAREPRISAIGFTGSRSAGLALMTTAASRPVPIPVYAEMSSVNPVFVLPGALHGDLDALAQGFLASVTGSSGQLCTSPGLIFVPAGSEGDSLVTAITSAFKSSIGQTMLTPRIRQAWQAGVDNLSSQPGVVEVAAGEPGTTENAPAPLVFEASAGQFVENPNLSQEIFGAATLIVRYDEPSKLVGIIDGMEGQLTVTLQLAETDHPFAERILPSLERSCGRILFGGWPTGVEVGHAVVHGGPFPATSDSRMTSVGSRAIERFLRPVSYQDAPDSLLPQPLKNQNPWNLSRLVDGADTRDDLGGSK